MRYFEKTQSKKNYSTLVFWEFGNLKRINRIWILFFYKQNRLLIESDGPFTKVNNQKYNPSKLQEVYSQIGAFLESPEINKLVWQNFKDLITQGKN